MILHIIPDQKVTLSFIQKMESVFDINNHYFWIFPAMNQKGQYKKYLSLPNFTYQEIDESSYKQLLELAKKASNIILHSIIANTVHLEKISKVINQSNAKISWVIWGADLYNDYWKSHSIRVLIKPSLLRKERIRRDIIKRIDYAATTFDYDVLKRYYKTKANCVGVDYPVSLIEIKRQSSNVIPHVMVGHSASRSCRHFQTFIMLYRHRNNIEIYCPLSYPNKHMYLRLVNSFGKLLYGKRYHPITSYMNYNQYVDFLNQMDIAVFNNTRQQGMGNITNLIYLGKKVYLSKKNTINKLYKFPEYYVFDSNEIKCKDFLTPLSHQEQAHNRIKIESLMSNEVFKHQWERLFVE